MCEASKKILPKNQILNDRYQIHSCLNIGPFVTLYQAFDLKRKDLCTIRELFPLDSIRSETDLICYQNFSPQEIFRLQHVFIEDAKEYSRIVAQEILSTRDIFNENLTRYHVIAHLEDKICLDQIWNNLPSFPLNLRLNIKHTLLNLLTLFKKYNFIHLQLTPKNIYFNQDFFDLVVMPGARSHLWYADKKNKHFQILDSSFTHSSCLKKDQIRTSQCDIYSVWKIFSHLFPEKYLGNNVPYELQDLHSIFDSNLSQKISSDPKKSVPKKFECPACNNLLETIKPLSKNVCPVCREGTLSYQKFAENACAKCKTGVLHLRSNTSQLQHCPICSIGTLSDQMFFDKKKSITICFKCHESFLVQENQVTRLLNRTQKPLKQWLEEAKRTEITHVCDNCNAQFDEEKDGLWKLFVLNEKNDMKYLPKEWSHLAAGMKEESGNTCCNHCHANFDFIQDSITLISSSYCISNFFNRFKFQCLDIQEIKWFGMDKCSPHPGLICKECFTEFDKIDKDVWKLVWTQHFNLKKHINEVHSLKEWHALSY